MWLIYPKKTLSSLKRNFITSRIKIGGEAATGSDSKPIMHSCMERTNETAVVWELQSLRGYKRRALTKALLSPFLICFIA